MALDKQKILNELESVVTQLQSANCGCLGNVFKNQHGPNSQQQMMGYNAPHSYGHNHTCGQNPGGPVGQGSCGDSCLNNQVHGNCAHHHPSNFGSTARNHFDPALVQPIVKDVYEELKSMTPENTVVNSPIANRMGLPIAKEGANMFNPCNAINMPNMQKAMENAKVMQAMGNSFMNAVNVNQNPVCVNEFMNTQENAMKIVPPAPTYNVMQCQNCRTTTSPVQQVANNILGQVPPTPQQIPQNQSPYGQHAQGMAKFQELFPGVMGNGDLGFDPMAVAINMNPNNNKQSIPMAQNNFNNINQANKAFTCAHLTPSTPQQLNASQNANEVNMRMTNPSIPPIGGTMADDVNVIQNQSNNGLYPNGQQTYQVSPRHITQGKVATDYTNPSPRPFHPATEKLLNEILPESRTTQNPVICEHDRPSIAPLNNIQAQPKAQTFEYNTLGQPVEILPAHIYHKPEESLPQTLSPVPLQLNSSFPAGHMQASMNKDFIVNNVASTKTPCMLASPMSYGTHSDGQLNLNLTQKNVNNFVERTVGDTAVNNSMSPRPQANLHAGDRPDAAPAAVVTGADGSPEKLSPNSDRKHRNGLQDIVYTSYPKSTKWSFHGNARKTLPTGQRPV